MKHTARGRNVLWLQSSIGSFAVRLSLLWKMQIATEIAIKIKRHFLLKNQAQCIHFTVSLKTGSQTYWQAEREKVFGQKVKSKDWKLEKEQGDLSINETIRQGFWGVNESKVI